MFMFSFKLTNSDESTILDSVNTLQVIFEILQTKDNVKDASPLLPAIFMVLNALVEYQSPEKLGT